MSVGLQPCPVTSILLLTMNNVFIEPSQQDVNVQQTASASNAPAAAVVEEVTVPASVAEIYDQILIDISEVKDV